MRHYLRAQSQGINRMFQNEAAEYVDESVEELSYEMSSPMDMDQELRRLGFNVDGKEYSFYLNANGQIRHSEVAQRHGDSVDEPFQDSAYYTRNGDLQRNHPELGYNPERESTFYQEQEYPYGGEFVRTERVRPAYPVSMRISGELADYISNFYKLNNAFKSIGDELLVYMGRRNPIFASPIEFESEEEITLQPSEQEKEKLKVKVEEQIRLKAEQIQETNENLMDLAEMVIEAEQAGGQEIEDEENEDQEEENVDVDQQDIREYLKLKKALKLLEARITNYLYQKQKQDAQDERHICKICYIEFPSGRQLGGHMSRKHPGSSESFRNKKLVHKSKASERQRRMFFKAIKKGRLPPNPEEYTQVTPKKQPKAPKSVTPRKRGRKPNKVIAKIQETGKDDDFMVNQLQDSIERQLQADENQSVNQVLMRDGSSDDLSNGLHVDPNDFLDDSDSNFLVKRA